jgi:transmembrane sensor
MSRKPEANEIADDAARIAAEAAEHFARFLNGKPRKAERKALADWLAVDPRHAKAYANLERIWQGSSELPELKSRKRKSGRYVSRRDIVKGAILLAAGAGVWRYVSDHPFADYRTGAGERRSVALPDGSRVELAAWTRLSVAIDGSHRRIVLHEGEAFFHVAPDRRPFTVEAGLGVTTALGTAFGVEYRGGVARVLVTEHAVNVKLDAQSAMVPTGSQVHYREEHLGVLETGNAEAALAWREGWLIFTARPLGEVVESLNRWRGGRLVVIGPALAQRPITLIVDLERLDDIPMQLEKALPVRLIQITSLLIFIVPS